MESLTFKDIVCYTRNGMFLPREKKFFDSYEALAGKIKESVNLLEELEKNYGQLDQIIMKLDVIENEADEIVHKIMNDLLYDHTRVTEEKGDIRFFAHNMDNVVDGIQKAVSRLSLYNIKDLPPVINEFTAIFKETAEEIEKGIKYLRILHKNGKDLINCCIRINELENQGDRVNRQWLQKIMMQPIKTAEDVRYVIALKEIIDVLEYSLDQCEDVANVLETFHLKGTV